MHYEINVAKDGRHYFATHERSLRDEEHAKAVLKKFNEAFPKKEGYEITVHFVTTSSRQVNFEGDWRG